MSKANLPTSRARVNPDHFDPTKYGPNGERTVNGRPAPRGKPARLKLEDVDQLLYLETLAKAAAADLVDFLESRGFMTKYNRAKVLNSLHKGWRPQR
jgi:hypothetical protein